MTNHPPSEELFAYRDGELDREKRGLIEAHVLSCTACRTRLEDMSDAEGALRQELADPDDAYFETMTRSVMGRVAPGAPERAGAARSGERAAKAAAAKGESRPAAVPPAPTSAEEATPGARRPKREPHLDDVHRGRAPGLPWPAIASAISAAAAVLVVAVILFRSPQAWLHAPKPEVVGLRKEAPPEAPVRESPPPAGTAAPSEPQNSKDVPTTNAPPSDLRAQVSQESKKDAANSLSSGNVAPLPLSKQAEEGEVRTQSADEALPELERQKEQAAAAKRMASTMGQLKSEASPAPAPAALQGDNAEGFGPLAARYGLPTLFDPDKVSHETLLRAEPEIRILYQTGRSGADSARVRLYLAEAARLRAGDSPDAETFDAIVHHYRRAVELARDPETARMARKRFEDFVSRTAPPR